QPLHGTRQLSGVSGLETTHPSHGLLCAKVHRPVFADCPHLICGMLERECALVYSSVRTYQEGVTFGGVANAHPRSQGGESNPMGGGPCSKLLHRLSSFFVFENV